MDKLQSTQELPQLPVVTDAPPMEIKLEAVTPVYEVGAVQTVEQTGEKDEVIPF